MSAAPTTRNSFDAVAEYYDRQPNPVVALEERYLARILPEVRGLDVVEIGCGTGRWLEKVAAAAPRSLTGIDPSAPMLSAAREKLGARARLIEGSVENIPLLDAAADLILIPFVLSYCDSLEHVAHEVARVARPDAAVFISDLHPETEATLNWRRSFRSASGSVEMLSARHSIKALADAFRRAGLELAAHLEVPFGAQDAACFAAHHKQNAFESARGLPAIYIAQFVGTSGRDRIALQKSRIALGAGITANVTLTLSNGKIGSIGLESRQTRHPLDLRDCMVLPGLINAHDHLEFALYPNLGGRGAYRNSVEWAEDIHRRHGDVIAIHERVPKDVRLYFGALRNLLSGVTSVCHHNPDATVFHTPDFPVRIVNGIAWGHSLAFEPDLRARFDETDQPFVVHAAEGTDERSASELAALERQGLLSERTVIVHALGCTKSDVERINRRNGSVVLCASSNDFLFGQTMSSERFQALDRSAIGTDSPLTACGDMLDELRFVRDKLALDCETLFSKCTYDAASVLKRADGSGRIRVGGVGDLLVVQDTGMSPAERLLNLRLEEIELVIVGGRVHFASESAFLRLPDELRLGLAPLRVDGVLCWVRAPLAWMFEQAQGVLGETIKLGGKRVEYAG